MKAEEKRALEQWEEHFKALSADVPIEDWLTPLEIEQKRARLEKNPIEWIKYFFPKYAKYEFADFHKRAIKRIIENDEWYEVLSWSRELAKSTVAMFVLMYLTLTGRKKFVVLASATITAAIRLLTPYRINFEHNPRLRQFYGDQMNLGMWREDQFKTKSGAMFVVLGAGSAPRGARNEAIRPDVIYMDDYDTDEDCRNIETLKKKWDWFENALYPTRSISEPTLILWCGNIIARDCCVSRAGKMANHWDIINIRDKNGKSTWPQKNTEEMIDRVLSKISNKAVQGEYFNNPVVDGTVFKNLVFGKVPALSKFRFLIAYGDPSTSNRKKSDSSTKSLILMGKLGQTYYVIKAFLDHSLNSEFIDWYFRIKDYVGGKTPVFYLVENNTLQDPFYEQVFCPLIREENKKRKTDIHIKGDASKKGDKASRIEAALEPLDSLGLLIFNESEQDNPHMKRLIDQFSLFETHLPYPADGPDACEGAKVQVDRRINLEIPVDTISYNDLSDFDSNYKF